MQMKLRNMKLKNFKGIQDFTLQVDGKNASVLGDNATGKTTLFDAWKWLLFDKDSSNRSDFGIKTLDIKTGEPFHHLEHEVEANILIIAEDGSMVPMNFRKQLVENWVKKRGQENQEFSGHETSYWVDEVPVKKSEYQKLINDLIDESIFKLITDPFYFNNMLKKEERRKAILEIAGEISDAEVIATNEKLKRLPEILEGRSIENHKKIIAERIRLSTEERKNIPPRIDELTNSLSDGLNVDYKAAEEELAVWSNKLSDTEKRLADGQQIASDKLKVQKELFAAKDELRNRKIMLDSKANLGVKAFTDEKSKLENEKYKLEVENTSLKTRSNGISNTIKANDATLEDLRNQFDKVDAMLFPDPDIDSSCPTCGQSIPEDQIQSKYTQMRATFEKNKNDSLDAIEANGLATKNRNDQLKKELEDAAQKIIANDDRLAQITSMLVEVNEKLSAPVAAPDYTMDPEYIELENKVNKLQTEMDKPIEDVTTAILEEKKLITAQIDEYKKILNNKEQNEKTLARIQELKEQEVALAKKITEYEGQKFLIENFIITKVNLMESKINSMFRYVTFKLFEVQINGGVNEVCETLIKGVPWNDANHEGRTNAGLDIINTLTKYYKVNAPIFIDYSESVNKTIETDSQVVKLKVTQDKPMKVEVE